MFHRSPNAGAISLALVALAAIAACAPLPPGAVQPAREVSSLGPQKAEGHTMAELFVGKFSGVQVLTASGGGITLRIRNGGTGYNRGAPLIVVDGVPMTRGTSELLFIDPADIDTIEVLKSAASSSFYGFQGVNGVVLITTKRSL